MIALASLPPWNELAHLATLRAEYRHEGKAGVVAGRRRDVQIAKLATQCAVCGTTSRPIRPEPSFPATAGRMRLFPGFPSSERRRRRHGTAGASLDFASCASITTRGSLPRNQKTAGVSHLPSFDD